MKIVVASFCYQIWGLIDRALMEQLYLVYL